MNILDIHMSRTGPTDVAFRTPRLIFHFPVLFRHFLPTHYIHRTARRTRPTSKHFKIGDYTRARDMAARYGLPGLPS